jgi:hypothetical protein
MWTCQTIHATNGVDLLRLVLLRLVNDVGEDLHQLWRDEYFYLSRDNLVKPEQMPTLLEAIEYITKHTDDGWYFIANFLWDVYNPTESNLEVLRMCFLRGMSRNAALIMDLRGSEVQRPLRMSASSKMSRMNKPRKQLVRQERNKHPQVDEISVEPCIAKHPDLWCITSALVQYGADIFWICLEAFDKASSRHELQSVWKYALKCDVRVEWFHAWEENGIDVDKYCCEDIRHCYQAIRLRGVTRWGVDERVLELPSISGPRYRPCRPCPRKYCNIHDRGIFDS